MARIHPSRATARHTRRSETTATDLDNLWLAATARWLRDTRGPGTFTITISDTADSFLASLARTADEHGQPISDPKPDDVLN